MVYATNFNAVGADILNALRLVPQYRISNAMNVSSRPSHTTVKADENVTSPSILKRSIVLGGHKTSVSLEDEFWISLRQIAGTRRESLSELIGTIDAERKFGNLSSAIRMFVLGYYRDRLDQAGGTIPFPSPMA